MIGYADLRAAPDARPPERTPDREHRIELTGGMMRYDWGINGRRYDPKRILPVHSGERVRLTFVNRTMMWHPMHLHGHTFALGPDGPRNDTVAVLPGQRVSADFDGDNPGRWMLHCHNTYHVETGTMTTLGYRK